MSEQLRVAFRCEPYLRVLEKDAINSGPAPASFLKGYMIHKKRRAYGLPRCRKSTPKIKTKISCVGYSWSYCVGYSWVYLVKNWHLVTCPRCLKTRNKNEYS